MVVGLILINPTVTVIFLIHNKYIQDNDMKLLDTRDMFTLKQKNILSNFNINITSNNYKLNEINKLITT